MMVFLTISALKILILISFVLGFNFLNYVQSLDTHKLLVIYMWSHLIYVVTPYDGKNE